MHRLRPRPSSPFPAPFCLQAARAVDFEAVAAELSRGSRARRFRQAVAEICKMLEFFRLNLK